MARALVTIGATSQEVDIKVGRCPFACVVSMLCVGKRLLWVVPGLQPAGTPHAPGVPTLAHTRSRSHTPLPAFLQAFAADLEKLFSSLQAIDAELIVQAGAGGTVSASVAADDAAVNRFLLDLVRWGPSLVLSTTNSIVLLICHWVGTRRFGALQLRVWTDCLQPPGHLGRAWLDSPHPRH